MVVIATRIREQILWNRGTWMKVVAIQKVKAPKYSSRYKIENTGFRRFVQKSTEKSRIELIRLGSSRLRSELSELLQKESEKESQRVGGQKRRDEL